VSANWGPAYGLLKEDHDAIVAARGRNVTDETMRDARPDEDQTATTSLIDTYINNRRGTPT
jgi:hypothetical protein